MKQLEGLDLEISNTFEKMEMMLYRKQAQEEKAKLRIAG